jgi:hypothetical protein
MNTQNFETNFGSHPLDHVVGLMESADLFLSEAENTAKIQAGGWSTIACISTTGGSAGCISSINPF